MDKILLAENWPEASQVVEALLKNANLAYDGCPLGEVASHLSGGDYQLVILVSNQTNLKTDSNAVLDIQQVNEYLPIVVISDNQHYEAAVDVMKLGAKEYLHYPVADEKLVKTIQHHLKLYQMTRKIYMMDTEENIKMPFESMIGQSAAMQENFRMIKAVAKSNATVMITGESGTGKELVAKAIHNCSPRAKHRFVDLNCGAIPKELLENELFGHEKGSFTGAHKRYQGSFEAAHKGTLFLDEVSELDPLLQVKLLRVLQERSFMRIGGTEKIDVDVRIIAATNRNFAEEIEKGQFREDLYYRLNVVNIMNPPLRERREDIPLLANHFLEYYTAKNNRIFIDFAPDAMETLINYDWPGNVRELENTIERIVVLHNDSQVKLKFLPSNIQQVNRDISIKEISQGMVEEGRVIPLDEMERQAIEMALAKYQGNVSIAAKRLKIGQATLYRKIKKYGLT